MCNLPTYNCHNKEVQEFICAVKNHRNNLNFGVGNKTKLFTDTLVEYFDVWMYTKTQVEKPVITIPPSFGDVPTVFSEVFSSTFE